MAEAIAKGFSGRITSPKDFWTGIIYVGVGLAALVVAWDYRMGIASRMGPGYFPKVLASILMFIGALSLVRSFTAPGEPIGKIAWKALVLITLSCVAFAWLLPRAGLVAALLALIFISAVASVQFRLTAKSLLAVAGLILFCLLIFVAGLGVPMSVFGSWFSPYTDPWTIPFQKEIVDPFLRDYVKAPWRALIAWISGLFGH